ncbi:MAG: TonB-dependent receptor [Verrucomicrobiota bacterium]
MKNTLTRSVTQLCVAVFSPLLCMAPPAFAQSDDDEVVTLPDFKVLPATRLSLKPFDQPYAFYRSDRVALNNNIGRTALDRIDYGPGVVLQRTAPGQTSPFIRGLTGKQSLLLLNGVRLSHATMRSGPNQYSAMIPDMSIESIDAILGSSSVVNGSDGLTGALDFRLAPAGRGVEEGASPWFGARVESANGLQTSAGVDGASKNWRYSFEASYYDFDERDGGDDASDNLFGGESGNDIPNTAYEQQAYAARAVYDGLEDRSFSIATGYTRQDDARRPDGYFENSGKDSRISRFYDPQEFTYLHVRDDWTPAGHFFDRLITTAWWHQHDEAQRREDLTSDNTVYRRREFDDRVDSIGLETQAITEFDQHQLTYGFLLLFEKTDNAYREFRNLGGITAAGATPHNPSSWSDNTTITDGAEYNTYAAYIQDLWRISEKFNLLSGLRYSYADWDFDVASSDADDVSGGVRASYLPTENTLTFIGLNKAFRAPNLNDLDGATDRGSSGTITFGNPDLDPEVSYTAEAGWRGQSDRDYVGVTVFYTHIDDIIQRVFPAGEDSGTTENGESAHLQGFEVQWDYGLPFGENVGERLSLFGNVSLVDTEAEIPQPDGSILKEPISRANRVYGKAGLHLDVNQNWWARAQVRFHDDYDDVASRDSGDVRLTVPGDDDGSVDGWAVVDLSGGWVNDEDDRWLTLTLENLADETYRPLGSGADAPGFNVVLSGGLRF